MSISLYRVSDRQRRAEVNDSGSPLRRLEYFDLEIRADVDFSSCLQFSTGMHHRLVAIIAERFEKQQLGGCSGVACAEKSRAEHAGGVEDDRVAGRDDAHDIAKRPMSDPLRVAMQNHQPAFVAMLGGSLSYAIRGEIEFVVAC